MNDACMSRLADLCELVSSLEIREVKMTEVAILGSQVGLVKHTIWADSLYFLYLMLRRISKILASS
jgi:hypothetical protein